MHHTKLTPGAAGTTPIAPAETGIPSPEIADALATARALAARRPKAAAHDLARVLLETTVGTLWDRVAPGRALRLPFVPPATLCLTPDEFALTGRIAAALAGRPLERISEVLGTLYTALLPQPLRAAQGSYYTPPALAQLLLDRASEAGCDWRRARVLDPACGGGAILLPALRRLAAAAPDQTPAGRLDAIRHRLRGVDLDPVAAWLAQIMVDLALLPLTRAAGAPAPRIVTVGDMLDAATETGAFDLVVGNPPYGQVSLKGRRKTRYARSTHGRPNLYGLFFDRALDLVSPGGVIAYLTPPGCLGGQSFQKLRGLLAHDAPPGSVDFVVQRQGVYADVVQETMISTWRQGAAPDAIRLAEVAISEAGCAVRAIGTGRIPARPETPWLLPRRVAHGAAARALAQATDSLVDWGYRVRTGPIEAPRVPDRIAEHPAPDHVPLLWADSIARSAGLVWPHARRKRGLWIDATGRDRQLTRLPSVLVQRTTAPEQPRRLVAACLPESFLAKHGPVAVENHLNVLEPVGPAPSVAPEVLAALLNSAAADTALRCLSGSTAVSAYELNALPLPAATCLETLGRLVADGAEAAAIEAECSRLYGMPPSGPAAPDR